MNIKTVVFDLDGTLIDSKKDIAVATNNALSELNLPTLPEEEIASFIGDGVEALIRRCLQEENISRLGEVLRKYKKVYGDSCTVYTRLYPGVKETIEFLINRGINVALATNKTVSISHKILRYFEIEESFISILGPEHVKNMKPDPDMIEILLDMTKNRPEDLLFVGDSQIDVLCGRNAGIYTCAVTYGIGKLESVLEANPDFLITDLRKLILLVS
ncbi:MAG: HAD-IA family hydrolase [Clostridiaceae bacterium]|nr:HAD-IA family hydrolase [Clostridiaceae bacterium]